MDDTALIGRSDEQAALGAMLEAARRGLSSVLVLSGEPGVGKTALLQHTMREAADLQVTAVAGIESETSLGHAALHRLLVPQLHRIETLPEPQRVAVSGAFGLVGGEPPDPYLVSLATLTLLSEVAADGPLLCVVDDAQWIDPESLAVLSVVGRRLGAEGSARLYGRRAPWSHELPLEGLPTRTVAGLSEEDAVRLLVSLVSGHVDCGVARRLAAETLGNPLALVEIARELRPGQLAGAEHLPDVLPLGGELEGHFLRQVLDVPAGGRLFLLVAAADSSGDPDRLDGAARALGLPDDAADQAVASGLLELEPRATFRHPMIRSVVLAAASTQERRRVHGALAAVLGQGDHDDRRAWHLAEATAAPDALVAGEIEEAGRRRIRRGGYATAAALLDRSARLSPTPEDRGRRLLAAAEAHLAAGNTGRAQEQLERSSCDLADPLLKAQGLRLEGALRLADGHVGETPSILVQAATALAPFDIRSARDTLLEASSAALFGGHITRTEAMKDVAAAAALLPLPPGEVITSGDLLLDAFATLFTDGHERAVPKLRRAVDAVLHDEKAGREILRWLGFGCWAAGALGDNDHGRALARRLVALSREWGALGELTRGLYFLGMADVVAGDLASGSTCFAEGRDLMATRGHGTSPGEAVVSAWRGDAAGTRRVASEVARAAEARGQAGVSVYAHHATVVLDLGLGQYAAALDAARQVEAEDSYFLGAVAGPDLVESAVRCRVRGIADRALERDRRRALASGTPLALGLVARSAALLATDDDAEACYLESLDQLGQTTAAGHEARTHLVYGEWLRRQHRRLDAREQLRAAHERFVAIGAQAFAQRARRELEATGERARKRMVDTTDDLTPQEAQVAELAAARATNGEIAAQLFISPATVDYHLRKVFRKLGISSRRDLPRALGSRD